MAGDLVLNVPDMYVTALPTGPWSTQSGVAASQLLNASSITEALKGSSPVHSTPEAEVAVVTPTRLRPDRIAYLLELYASLREQDLGWEWVLALDGVSEEGVPKVLRADARVKVVALPKPVGAGAARNFAVNEVSADWLTTSDDDDVLPAQSLSVRLRYAQRHDLGWCAGWSADLHPDRSITPWRCSTPPGFHAPGDVWRYWASPDSTIPIGPTTLLARTAIVRASGGYAALPQGEDYAYFVGVTGAARGALLPTVVYHYRKHSEQMTAQPEYPAMELQARRFAWNHGKHLESLRKETCV
ncbi:glycosyltransferase family 2 protein [Streptomyces sp. ADMS]|uniref:glycosyltransferase family 2 protein n=1 Tax=Streptomyces sp. ADMS TaxID=3071415 RepID=UPI00296FC748|nr:glycosyltransferase family 2 protein [Streptomyces sp. ADMS]MDW4910675.1 glycosyltransferase family 2 protein [Streptomyces sp. ADMS]